MQGNRLRVIPTCSQESIRIAEENNTWLKKRILQMRSRKICCNPNVLQTLKNSRLTFNLSRADGPCQNFSHSMGTPILFFRLALRHNFPNLKKKRRLYQFQSRKKRRCEKASVLLSCCVSRSRSLRGLSPVVSSLL